jgi:hypothetical protein
VLLPPSSEAKAIANRALDRLRERTRPDLLSYGVPDETTVRTDSGAAYKLRVFTFLDSDDPDSDLFVEVRVRPAGGRLHRAAGAGFMVDAESRLWHRGEHVGDLPTSSS